MFFFVFFFPSSTDGGMFSVLLGQPGQTLACTSVVCTAGWTGTNVSCVLVHVCSYVCLCMRLCVCFYVLVRACTGIEVVFLILCFCESACACLLCEGISLCAFCLQVGACLFAECAYAFVSCLSHL